MVQIYDPNKNTWSTGANIPTGVGSAQTAYINGNVYLCGGINTAQTTVNTCWMYKCALCQPKQALHLACAASIEKSCGGLVRKRWCLNPKR